MFPRKPNGKRGTSQKKSSSKRQSKLSPEQLAVIVGLLTNALTVQSVLLDRDKTVQIVLEGSLRRKTRMDRLLEEMKDMSIGELLASLQKQFND